MSALITLILSLGMPYFSYAKPLAISFDSPMLLEGIKKQLKEPKLLKSQKNLPGVFASLSPNNGAELIKEYKNLGIIIIDTEDTSDLKELSKKGFLNILEDWDIPAPPKINAYKKIQANASLAPLGLIEEPWGIDAINAEATWNHVNFGSGVRVLILDTGIDKDHPDIADNFEKGKNFTEVNEDAPYDYFDDVGHGTHVAGTIAATGDHSKLVGVAPKATILAGKVCATERCSGFAILDGLEWALEQEVDIVNLSLGGHAPNQVMADAYRILQLSGITVVAASGNEEEDSVGYPGAYSTTIAVGAVNEELEKTDFSNWGEKLDVVAPGANVISSVPQGTGIEPSMELSIQTENGLTIETIDAEFMPFIGTGRKTISELELVYVGLGQEEDVSEADLEGKVALIRRGEISFFDKARNAVRAGAEAVLIFNDSEDPDFDETKPAVGTLGDDVRAEIFVLGISKEVGLALLKGLRATDEKVTFSAEILKTDYQAQQGTSMAAPHVTGLVALMIAANPELNPQQIKKILKETSTELDGDNSENQLGSGLVNSEAAVELALSTKGVKLTEDDVAKEIIEEQPSREIRIPAICLIMPSLCFD